VPLALLNPDLRILAVEALPENVAVLMANIERNGVQDRVQVVHAAASDSAEPVRIMYGEVADASGQHQFIGNEYGPEGSTFWTVKGATLRGLMLLRGPDEDCPFVWTKLDCEGCEYKVLASPWVTHLPVIIGEVHRGWDALVRLLESTHDVTGDGQDFGHFQAHLKVQA
jgi:FkbM family methyltransferase